MFPDLFNCVDQAVPDEEGYAEAMQQHRQRAVDLESAIAAEEAEKPIDITVDCGKRVNVSVRRNVTTVRDLKAALGLAQEAVVIFADTACGEEARINALGVDTNAELVIECQGDVQVGVKCDDSSVIQVPSSNEAELRHHLEHEPDPESYQKMVRKCTYAPQSLGW